MGGASTGAITSRRSSRGAEPPVAVTVGVVARGVRGRRRSGRRCVVGGRRGVVIGCGRRGGARSGGGGVVVGRRDRRGRHPRVGAAPGRGGEAAEAADGDDPGDGRPDRQAADAVDRPVSIGGAAGRWVHVGHLPDRFFPNHDSEDCRTVRRSAKIAG